MTQEVETGNISLQEFIKAIKDLKGIFFATRQRIKNLEKIAEEGFNLILEKQQKIIENQEKILKSIKT